jgi:hypothetical protein
MSDFQNEQPTETGTTETKRDPFSAFLHHQKRAFEESVKAVDALLPEGFKAHSREAGSEFAKSVQVWVDVAAEGLDKVSKELDRSFRRAASSASEDEGDRPSTTGPNKVKVQVD